MYVAAAQSTGPDLLKNEKYYLDRAAYMREIARDAHTEKLRESCLKAAEQLDALAKLAAKRASGEDTGEDDGSDDQDGDEE